MKQGAKAVKVALVGYGHLGKWHAQKADGLSSAELVAIVEPSAQNAQVASAAHPNVKVVSSLDEIIDQIDAAIVVTPTSFHYDVAKKLLEKNKHVFCEKPICNKLIDALELQKIYSSKKDLVFQTGHSERFHKAWEILREKYPPYLEADSRSTFTLNRMAAFKGRATDVDVVSDLMIHDLDLLVFICQEMPVSITAHGHKMRTNHWDYVSANFEFASGRSAVINVSRNHIEEVRRFDVSCSEGTLAVDLFTNQIIHASAKADAANAVEKIPYEKRDHLLLEQMAFYDSILNGNSAVVSMLDGIKALTLVDKVLESLKTGRTVRVE